MLLVASVFLVSQGLGRSDAFCNLDGPLFDDGPPGWHWQRDGGNDCEWTLFNDQGDRAPDAIYEDMRISPPPPLPFVPNLIGLVGVVLSLSGIGIVVFQRDGHGRELTSSLSEPPAKRP
jgi:hypothetical protein